MRLHCGVYLISASTLSIFERIIFSWKILWFHTLSSTLSLNAWAAVASQLGPLLKLVILVECNHTDHVRPSQERQIGNYRLSQLILNTLELRASVLHKTWRHHPFPFCPGPHRFHPKKKTTCLQTGLHTESVMTVAYCQLWFIFQKSTMFGWSRKTISDAVAPLFRQNPETDASDLDGNYSGIDSAFENMLVAEFISNLIKWPLTIC